MIHAIAKIQHSVIPTSVKNSIKRAFSSALYNDFKRSLKPIFTSKQRLGSPEYNYIWQNFFTSTLSYFTSKQGFFELCSGAGAHTFDISEKKYLRNNLSLVLDFGIIRKFMGYKQILKNNVEKNPIRASSIGLYADFKPSLRTIFTSKLRLWSTEYNHIWQKNYMSKAHIAHIRKDFLSFV